jgi:hypothetical protein
MSPRTTFDLTSPAVADTRRLGGEAGEHLQAAGTEPRRAVKPRPSMALALRRGFLVASPVLAGVLATVGAVADPAAGYPATRCSRCTSTTLPSAVQVLAYHWSYAFGSSPRWSSFHWSGAAVRG